MEVLKLLIPIAGSFLAGGGLMWIFHFRLRSRRDGNIMLREEFNAVSEIVDRSTRQISDLAEKIAKIEEEKAVLKAQVLMLIEENGSLKRENNNMSTALKRFMSIRDASIKP